MKFDVYLPNYKASHAGKQYFLLLQLATILLLYHNCRKSRETHCGQCDQKVATQTYIQCVFHLLHEPVKEDMCKDIAEESILPRILHYVFMAVV
jgi:hypothetical protein